ncbi:MAG TPA: hypothetical protein VJV96_12315 [Candidatus Angelobacter sp.]|jgi:hypothetical protein|nr:hypothetical protein [Candidatus Angelobacter sp.]
MLMRRLLLIFVAAAFAAPAMAQSNVGITVQLSQSGPSGQAPLQSAANTTFTMPPSVTSSKLNPNVQTLPLTISCIDLFTGAIINNCNVTITHKPEAFSGGHNHDSSTRPKGQFQPSSGNTGTSGLNTTYTSPEVSGIIDVTLTGTDPNGNALVPSTFTIGVQISGLVSLPAGANYSLVGQTANHGDNHYGTATMNATLVNLANSYVAVFPNNPLAYNDMSLVTGGLFDISGGWSKPHVSHRLGNDGDLRFPPVNQRRRARQLIYASGISLIIVEGDHWHLRQ